MTQRGDIFCCQVLTYLFCVYTFVSPCRKVELLIQELVVLVQRSEEYTYFLTSHMRDAVTRETEAQQAAAAQRAAVQHHHQDLQRRLSGRLSGVGVPDTPTAAAGAGGGGAGRSDSSGTAGNEQL